MPRILWIVLRCTPRSIRWVAYECLNVEKFNAAQMDGDGTFGRLFFVDQIKEVLSNLFLGELVGGFSRNGRRAP